MWIGLRATWLMLKGSMDNPFISRKLIMTAACLIVITVLPLVYHHNGISDQITLVVVAAISAAGGVYNAANVIAKKFEGSNDKPNS